MLRKLEWLHELDIQYDASTFDTDPFEPQPEGYHTIFPLWIPRADRSSENSNSGNSPSSTLNGSRSGYVELPYTLPQDSTLFLLLREETPEIWFRKLDWIAEHGGMALLITHPDYMNMNGESQKTGQYPVELYEKLLRYIQDKYSGAYWLALPREVAAHGQQTAFAPLQHLNGASPEQFSKSLPKPGSNVTDGQDPKVDNRWRLPSLQWWVAFVELGIAESTARQQDRALDCDAILQARHFAALIGAASSAAEAESQFAPATPQR